MTCTVTISERLALALETRRKQAGLSSLDAAAEMLLAEAIEADGFDFIGESMSVEQLGQFIAEGEASGPAVQWDAETVREEIHRRFAAQQAQ